MMHYERPFVEDFGSIADHTFTRCSDATGGGDDPPKDYQICEHDKFGECSCGATGLSG